MRTFTITTERRAFTTKVPPHIVTKMMGGEQVWNRTPSHVEVEWKWLAIISSPSLTGPIEATADTELKAIGDALSIFAAKTYEEADRVQGL